jgi:NAD(P)-dependent dehydrogenase (short-subunit alcohol dehydrogenase family)
MPNGAPARGRVVVTGASSGIGRAAALHLNALGYDVSAGVRKEEDGERLRADAAAPERLAPLQLDVTDAGEVASARAEVEALCGAAGLRALFSNAGVATFSGDVSCEGCPIETQQRVMAVNHFGAVRVIQAFLPLLRAGRGTVVVNSALMAHTVLPFNGGYGASKAALESWCDALRREVRPHGVRVAMIEAGFIASELAGKQHAERVPAGGLYPGQRAMAEQFGRAEERFGSRPGASPERFAEQVAAAIAARHPRPRSIVGLGARPIWLIGALPDRAQDAIFGRMLSRLGRRRPR